jgi:hypothetical protein
MHEEEELDQIAAVKKSAAHATQQTQRAQHLCP